MAFDGELMADPVVASDGITYERHAIELWMTTHDVSPLTNQPFDHKLLIPNMSMRSMVAKWCEQNGVPVPAPPKREAVKAAGGGAALAPLLTKPQVTCSSHPKEQLRAFCTDCCCAVCVLCAVDVKRCKAHGTEALDTVIEELKTDREAWSLAQEECRRGVEHVCLAIQADADAKKQAIDSEAAALQQQVRAAGAERAAAFGAIVHKRQEREELVAAAAASPDIAVQGSPAAAVIVSALERGMGAIPPASAAEFHAAAAPATAVGHLVLAPAVADPEDAAAIAAAAAAAAEATAVAAMLAGSALLQRVADRNKVQQFAALMRARLAGKGYRKLYTWSTDGRSNASFHQRCDNQVGGIGSGLRLCCVTV